MFYILSKTLKVLLFPMTWTLVLLIIAVFIKDKKHSRRKLLFFSLACFIFLIFSCEPLLDWARYRTTHNYAEQPLPTRHHAVAVVMGGFGEMNGDAGQMNTYGDRGGRIYEAVRLQRMGLVDRILITGDASVQMRDDSTSTAPQMMLYVSQFGVPQKDILVEQHARNTRENATLSIALLDSLGYAPEDCLLITSASHMRRSLGCFAQEGWEVEPYAVNIYGKPYGLKFKNFIPSYKTLIDWQELINEWVGNVAYRVVGYKK